VTDPNSAAPLPPAADPWSDADPTPYLGAGHPYLGAGHPIEHTAIDPHPSGGTWPGQRATGDPATGGRATGGRAAGGRPPTGAGTAGPPYVVFVQAPRRRRWPWVLTTLAALGGLCCGIGAVVTRPMWEQYPATVTVGENVAGLRQLHSAEVDRLVEQARQSIRTEQGVEQAFAAVLADPADESRMVVIFGATRFFLAPAKDLDGAIRDAGDDVRDIRAYPAGELGGEVRCGNGRDRQQPVVVCAWIDHGSVAAGVFYGERTMDESATLFSAIRHEVLRRA
jgi:hypothetical protein